jgi:MFS family permease
MDVMPRHRLYYGWVLVGTLSVTEMTSWGILYYAFTVFIDPLHQQFGWSRGAITGAYALGLALSGGMSVLFGRWVDRHGPRLLMTVGSCAATVLVLLWATVHSLLGLYLVWLGLGLTLAAVLYEPAFVVVALWFRRQRARALTLLTFVGGLASVVFVPLAGWLVHASGWQTALVVLAVILAVVTIPPHALLLRHRPEDRGLLPDGATQLDISDTGDAAERSVSTRTALHGAAFWLLTAAFALNTLGASAMLIHLVPYLTDHGYRAASAATVTGLVGVMALPGRLVLTPLADRVPRAAVACAIFLLQVAALLALLLVPSTTGVVLFVLLFGAGFGAVTPARAALVAEYYGPRAYGAISGVVAFFLTGARAAGPVLAGLLYDLTGGYHVAFWGVTGASLFAAAFVVLADRRAGAARAGAMLVPDRGVASAG